MAHNCEFCGQSIGDNLEKCPNCGANNAHYQRAAIKQPKTIEELKLWYEQNNLPPEDVTRFFIGKNYTSPKAYGIFKDPVTNKFIVYKNKESGERAVRYEGDDEAYAVNEIFQKLREVISVQKGMNAVDKNHGKKKQAPLKQPKRRKGRSFITTFLSPLIFIIIMIIYALSSCFDGYAHPDKDKYYKYKNDYYYNFNGKYYQFDEDLDDWTFYGNDAPFDVDDYEDYEIDRGDYSVGDFHDSDVYQDWYEDHHNNSNYDDDDDWDSGWDSDDGWDSDFGSDWDSDW